MDGGSTSADQVSAHVASLSNKAGSITQTGTGVTRIAAVGALVNDGGTIATNANDVELAAGGTLSNADGHLQHAGAGTLKVDAGSLSGARGELVSNGALVAHVAGSLSQDGGTTAARQITIDAGSFSNVAGTVAQTGTATTHIATVDDLVNDGGTIKSNATDIDFTAGGKLSNAGGQLQHAGTGALTLNAAAYSGTAGKIIGNGQLVAHVTGAFNQDAGTISAKQVTLEAGNLSNRAGEIVQTGAGATRVAVTGTLDNTKGTIASNGEDVALAASTLLNTNGAVQHAGTGSLGITAGTFSGASGSVVSNGDLIVQAGTFNQDGGSTSAKQISIDAADISNVGGTIVQSGTGATRIAASGALNNDRGTIATNGADLSLTAGGTLSNVSGKLQHAGTGVLNITADSYSGASHEITTNGALVAHVAGALNQDGGTTSAQQITIDAGSISNVAGTVTQTGTGDTHIAATGNLVNDGGTIATNGDDLAVAAGGALSNINGHLRHAGTGTFGLTAARYGGAGGELLGNGKIVAAVNGVFEQNGGTTSARQVAIDAASISNRAGQIVQTGSGTLHAYATGTLDNTAGLIGTATSSGGAVDLKFQAIANQGGRISSDGNLLVESTGDLRNDSGSIRAAGNLAVRASGTVSNAQGAIEAAGAASSLSLQAAQIDNTEGRVANGGIGDTTITAGTVTNGAAAANGAGGLIAGNGGVVVNATTLNNLANGILTSGKAMALGVNGTVTNRGTIASNGALTFSAANATLDNTAGGEVTAAGNLYIAVNGVRNDGGRIATTDGSGGDLTVIANTFSNHGGKLSSDRDLQLALPGSYVNESLLHAGRNLTLSLGGDLTNTATGILEAGGTLRTDIGGRMTNAQGGVVQAGNVDLHVVDALSNGGEITGNTVNVAADSVANTGSGAITGGDVTLSARVIINQGAQALIAATGDVSLWVSDTLNNVDGATIYSGRDIHIGANSALNADGYLANSSAAVVNRAATIEAERNIDIAANTLLNERPGVAIEQVQSLDETHTLSMPTWWHNSDNNKGWYNPAAANYIPFEVYYVNPADILESSTVVTPDGYQMTRVVIKTHANDTAFFNARAGRDGAYGHRERITMTDGTRVLYALGRQDGAPNPDQVPGITSGVWQDEANVVTWDAPAPAFDPAYGNCSTNCVRFYAEPGYTDPNSIMIRVTQVARGPATSLYELTRTAHTTAIDDRLAAGAGTIGRIVAGGDIRVGFSGGVTNRYGEIMAGGQLKLQGAQGATVDNIATTLYRRYAFDGVRHYADGVNLTYTQPDISMAIGSVSGVLSGAQGVSITGGAIRNIDTSAGSAANIVGQVQLTSGGAPGSTGPVGAAAGSGVFAANGATANAANGMNATAASGVGASATGGGAVAGANGSAAGTANGAAAGGGAGGVGTTVALRNPGSSGGAGLPSGGLFTAHPASTSRYLFETRSAFTNYRDWASSDYFFNTLGLNPDNIQKRLGDGFYEQKLIREQIAELTGRRYLSGYGDDDTQYLELMKAGATFAEQYGLRPGIALSAEQMKTLTSDIVWMETQTVTLADGSTQQVLVPKVYLAQAGPNALKPNGALITGDDIHIEGDSIVNRGGTVGGAGTQRAVLVASADIVNQGGTLKADQLGLQAGGNIRNETLTVSQSFSQSDGRIQATGSNTSLSNVGRIEATEKLQIEAGGNFVDQAGRISSGGTASIKAGGDVRFEAVETGSSYQATIGSSSLSRERTEAQVGTLSTGRDLSVSGGKDVVFNGTQVDAGGNASFSAGRNLSFEAATSSSASDQRNDREGSKFRQTRSETTVQGASVKAGGDLTATAGTSEAGDLRVIGSALDAKGDVKLKASQDIVIGTAQTSIDRDDYTRSTSKGFLKEKTTVDQHTLSTTTAVGSSVAGKNVMLDSGRDAVVTGSSLYAEDALRIDAKRDVRIEAAYDTATSTDFTQVTKTPSGIAKALGSGGAVVSLATLAPDPGSANLLTRKDVKDGASQTSTQVVGSTLSAGSIDIRSGRDTTVVGSTLVADNDVSIDAGRDLTIRSAQSTSTSTSNGSTQASGNVGSFWKPAIGRASSTTDGQESATVQVGSQIASLDGNVKLTAGGTYTQTASDVTALGTGADGKAGNIDITARNVVINEAYDTRTSAQQTEAKSLTAGGTASVPLYNAAQSTAGTARATSQVGDSRMQALGTAVTAYNAYKTYEAATNPGYKVGAMLSDSHSQSSSTQSSRTAVGSTVSGAGNVNITATGGGADSNLTATAASISGNNVSLSADNAVTLQSARSTSDYDYQQSGSKYGVGVSYSVGAQNGMTIDLAAGSNRGTGSGSDSTNVNTYVTATNTATIKSGGNTTLDGAVVQAEAVKAEVGGDLRIQSQQDTSTATAKQSGGGFDASICYFWCYGTPVVAGGSVNTAGGKGQYASVTEQSGIQAGDGGFDVKVVGNTNLVGSVIASTDKAVDGGKNSFTTGSLTMTDVVNVDTFRASGYSVSGSYGGTANGGAGINGGSVGVGSASSGSTSNTTSGISGVAGNAQVRTGDGSNGLTPSWVASELLKDVNAQVRITSTATGILVEMTPQIVDKLNALLAGGNPSGRMAPSEIDRARGEFDRLQNDPSLTPEQQQQLQTLQTVFNKLIAKGQSMFGTPGGPDTVVGGGNSANTPVVFALAGVGAAGAGTAAGAAGAAGLNGASGTNQGYRDPDSGQLVGGAPPLTLPPLPSLDQLAATNPVLGPILRVYNAILQEMSDGGQSASAPSGRSGSPIEIAPGSNEPAVIGGRDYTGHALDRMQGRGVPPSAVEDAIQNGQSAPGNMPGTTVHTGQNGVVVVTGGRGQVITVIK